MVENFKIFLENITLTDAQMKDAKTKYEGVCGCLEMLHHANGRECHADGEDEGQRSGHNGSDAAAAAPAAAGTA